MPCIQLPWPFRFPCVHDVRVKTSLHSEKQGCQMFSSQTSKQKECKTHQRRRLGRCVRHTTFSIHYNREQPEQRLLLSCFLYVPCHIRKRSKQEVKCTANYLFHRLFLTIVNIAKLSLNILACFRIEGFIRVEIFKTVSCFIQLYKIYEINKFILPDIDRDVFGDLLDSL